MPLQKLLIGRGTNKDISTGVQRSSSGHLNRLVGGVVPWQRPRLASPPRFVPFPSHHSLLVLLINSTSTPIFSLICLEFVMPVCLEPKSKRGLRLGLHELFINEVQ